jgi:hypothetical protein
MIRWKVEVHSNRPYDIRVSGRRIPDSEYNHHFGQWDKIGISGLPLSNIGNASETSLE